MRISRRQALGASLWLGGTSVLAGCERLISTVSEQIRSSVPANLPIANDATIDDHYHVLSRAAFGVSPLELQSIRNMGRAKWLEQQLHPGDIDDKLCDLRTRRFETMYMDPGMCYEFKKDSLRSDLVRHTLLRAVYSARQLQEVMVEFWSDHLNIYVEKGDCIYLKAHDDRGVIRKHALGNFHDMIRASATSPAMLVYLDGKDNKKMGPSGIPNENYARELLELHALGVHGGYTQQDVYEVARALTGWRLKTQWQRGSVYFDGELHDAGIKHVLGHTISADGGSKDIDEVVDIVCKHPATAQHIASKLVRHFVSDDPPPSLVQRVAQSFAASNGDVKNMLNVIFSSDEFATERGAKLKRPFRYVVSALRATAADTYASPVLVRYLQQMGQALYEHPTPDGYPDVAPPWLGTLFWRWNFALALVAHEIDGTTTGLRQLESSLAHAWSTQQRGSAGHVNALFAYLIGRTCSSEERASLNAALADQTKTKNVAERHEDVSIDTALIVGLTLASPAFQRH